MRVIRIELLKIEILNIRNGVGDAPGDMLIVSNNDAGSARKACTGHIKVAS